MSEIVWYKRKVVFFEPLFAVLSLIGGFFYWPLWILALVFVALTYYETKK